MSRLRESGRFQEGRVRGGSRAPPGENENWYYVQGKQDFDQRSEQKKNPTIMCNPPFQYRRKYKCDQIYRFPPRPLMSSCMHTVHSQRPHNFSFIPRVFSCI